jgi:hypothetical protein
MVDKHNPQPYNRNYIVLLDCPENMCIAMSKFIRQFNFKMFCCPRVVSHGNAHSDGSWEASRTSKASSEID